MRLPVSIHGCWLVALLASGSNSGSTHNFIDMWLMSCLRLVKAPHPTMLVWVATGDHVPCHRVARGVALAIGTEEFVITLSSINLGRFKVILGAEFLRTLGPIL